MVFKNFRFRIIVRVIILALFLGLLAWCAANGLYLRSVYIAAGAIVVIIELISYADRFNRDMKTFLISLQQQDFTTHFQSTGKGKSLDELYSGVNSISSSCQRVTTEKSMLTRRLYRPSGK
jgi:two-component system nitrogen regulation sensor histidine kinase NtrY